MEGAIQRSFNVTRKYPLRSPLQESQNICPCDQLFLFTPFLTISILIILFNYKESSNG